nr:MAG TPA: hypothetical protein [Caudoviricetes sp.]DAS22421.1 MAG TPA: hypothetical protein [Caudoviricetes sp.]
MIKLYYQEKNEKNFVNLSILLDSPFWAVFWCLYENRNNKYC